MWFYRLGRKLSHFKALDQTLLYDDTYTSKYRITVMSLDLLQLLILLMEVHVLYIHEMIQK